MLPKSKRLNLKLSFGFVRSGKRSETLHFKLMYRLGENEEPLVGVAITSKNFKTAVLRNKAKRRSYLAIEPVYHLLQRGLNLVIMPKAGIESAQMSGLTEEIVSVEDLFTRN